MEIIKRGKIPHYKYKFKCNKCKTFFEVEETELEVLGNPDLEIIDKYYKCPVCKKRVYKDETIITIKCYKED